MVNQGKIPEQTCALVHIPQKYERLKPSEIMGKLDCLFSATLDKPHIIIDTFDRCSLHKFMHCLYGNAAHLMIPTSKVELPRIDFIISNYS